MDIVSNDRYFVARLNAAKALKFTAYYHYSGQGFRPAKINLGVYDKKTNKLVGVLQWGCSYQSGIKLSRYVKQGLEVEEYLQLNRFCMADSQEKNSESQAISLGVKFLKRFHPQIRLLVSYSGRKQGNYGYIYQATNWTYLGYFISPAFWEIDGVERHQVSLWCEYERHSTPEGGWTDYLKNTYSQVIQTWTKQFIYVQLLDKKLHLASDVLPYPKPSNQYPIKTNEKIFKDEPFTISKRDRGEQPQFYYEQDEQLFTRRTYQNREVSAIAKNIDKYNIHVYDDYGKYQYTWSSREQIPEQIDLKKLIRSSKYNRKYNDNYYIIMNKDGTEAIKENIPVCITFNYAVYNVNGQLEKKFNGRSSLKMQGYQSQGILKSIRTGARYKDKYFRQFTIHEQIPQTIDNVEILCIVDEIPFATQASCARYLGCSRQAINDAKNRQAKMIKGKPVIWK